jgi:hypothetical protein
MQARNNTCRQVGCSESRLAQRQCAIAGLLGLVLLNHISG